MGAGQSDLYKGTYGDTIENIPDSAQRKSSDGYKILTEAEVRDRYISELSKKSPKEIYEKMIADGCEVKPLGRGEYKGLSFKEGGGFRIQIGKDGVFQYHPEGRHHNNGKPYYKLSTGYSGKIRFDINGGILDE